MLQPHGPALPDGESVYRAILYPQWWNHAANCPSSAAFDEPVFSVDVVSRTTPLQTRGRFRITLHLVQFQCGAARAIGFDSRDEPDSLVPDNLAHAHVYFLSYSELSNKRRKAQARRLAELCMRIPD